MNSTNGQHGGLTLLILVGLLASLLAWPVLVAAAPTGASVTFISNTTANASNPGNRTDARGTITTLKLDATQQDGHWKGYVGNVSGKLTLDDANKMTIYDWSLTGVTIQGRVYVTRNASILFASVTCAANATVNTEDGFNNITGTSVDSINQTFVNSTHKAFYVGATPIANSTCRAIATFVNDTPQSISEAMTFQEILLQDSAANLIYTTIIEPNLSGFDSNTYDFQLIVAESGIKVSPTTYYFFTEIG
jgi:hypothetical protein